MPSCEEIEGVLAGPMGERIMGPLFELEGTVSSGRARIADWQVVGLEDPECFTSPPIEELHRRVAKGIPIDAPSVIEDVNVAFFIFVKIDEIPRGQWERQALIAIGSTLERRLAELFLTQMEPPPEQLGFMPFGFFDSTVPRAPATPVPGVPLEEQLAKVRGALLAYRNYLPGALFRAFLRWLAPPPGLNGPRRRNG